MVDSDRWEVESLDKGDSLLIKGQCRFNDHHDVSVIVPAKSWHEWRNGKLIQDAMPTLSVDDREFLISGICGKCFDEMF
jgi:hypothetical protein